MGGATREPGRPGPLTNATLISIFTFFVIPANMVYLIRSPNKKEVPRWVPSSSAQTVWLHRSEYASSPKRDLSTILQKCNIPLSSWECFFSSSFLLSGQPHSNPVSYHFAIRRVLSPVILRFAQNLCPASEILPDLLRRSPARNDRLQPIMLVKNHQVGLPRLLT